MRSRTELSEMINLDRFKELSDGNQGDLVDLVDLYLSKTSEQLRDLDKAIRKKTASEVTRLAHSMIGANAMVGMNTLLPALRRLEELGDKNDLHLASESFIQLEKEYERIQTALKKLMSNPL